MEIFFDGMGFSFGQKMLVCLELKCFPGMRGLRQHSEQNNLNWKWSVSYSFHMETTSFTKVVPMAPKNMLGIGNRYMQYFHISNFYLYTEWKHNFRYQIFPQGFKFNFLIFLTSYWYSALKRLSIAKCSVGWGWWWWVVWKLPTEKGRLFSSHHFPCLWYHTLQCRHLEFRWWQWRNAAPNCPICICISLPHERE